MLNIVLVFSLYLMCSIYVDYVFCLNKVLIIFMSIILFKMCLVFMSSIDHVQFILYADIFMVILRLVFGMLSMFI